MQGSCSKINMQVEHVCCLVGIGTDGASANIAAAKALQNQECSSMKKFGR